MANETISVVTKTFKPLKPGQKRTYRLTGLGINPETKRFSCPNSRQIANQFLINDGGVVKSFAFVKHQNPSTRSDSIPASQMGRIVFTRSALGEIVCYGDRADQIELDKALYFHQQNLTNRGAVWHVPPTGGNYVFERVDRVKKAIANVEMIERKIEAEQVIYKFEKTEIADLYELVFKTSGEGFSEDELRGELYEYVQDDANAKAILILKDDQAMQIKKVIRAAKDRKYIKIGTNGTSMLWAKGDELICTKLPRKTIEQSLLIYLVTDEGREVLKTLKDLTEAKK